MFIIISIYSFQMQEIWKNKWSVKSWTSLRGSETSPIFKKKSWKTSWAMWKAFWWCQDCTFKTLINKTGRQSKNHMMHIWKGKKYSEDMVIRRSSSFESNHLFKEVMGHLVRCTLRNLLKSLWWSKWWKSRKPICFWKIKLIPRLINKTMSRSNWRRRLILKPLRRLRLCLIAPLSLVSALVVRLTWIPPTYRPGIGPSSCFPKTQPKPTSPKTRAQLFRISQLAEVLE